MDASLRVAILSASAADSRRYFVVFRLKHPVEEAGTVLSHNNIARTEVCGARAATLHCAEGFVGQRRPGRSLNAERLTVAFCDSSTCFDSAWLALIPRSGLRMSASACGRSLGTRPVSDHPQLCAPSRFPHFLTRLFYLKAIAPLQQLASQYQGSLGHLRCDVYTGATRAPVLLGRFQDKIGMSMFGFKSSNSKDSQSTFPCGARPLHWWGLQVEPIPP